jgi:hypothetical protein
MKKFNCEDLEEVSVSSLPDCSQVNEMFKNKEIFPKLKKK